jgi:hypothetical protein
VLPGEEAKGTGEVRGVSPLFGLGLREKIEMGQARVS